nr:TMV resistance protein N-like [Populus alba]
MASGKYQESSFSRFSSCKYQVFLSFRGEDTRKNFTDHLYTALVQAGIHTFRDDDEIGRGENIKSAPTGNTTIKNIDNRVLQSIALSRWCLDELVMIMERKRNTDCIILPVFYDVDPSEVRNQTGSFAAAFVDHEKRFKKEMEQVNGWRIALKEVADLGGMVLGDGYEAQLVQSIVEKVGATIRVLLQHNAPLIFINLKAGAFYQMLEKGQKNPMVRTLIVLDDVDKWYQFNAIVGMQNWLFQGSKIVVTSRNKASIVANDRTSGNRFNAVLEYDENEMLGFYEEEGLIQKEFEEHLSFKISVSSCLS